MGCGFPMWVSEHEKTGGAYPSGQLVKKFASGDFFDDFCTVCLGAFGSPGGKRR